MKKKTLTTIILIVALAMVAAVTVYAVANYGTKEDPLVTSSYRDARKRPDAHRPRRHGAPHAHGHCRRDAERRH